MTAELHALFGSRDLVSAGKMAALDLEQLKTHLGPKWDKLSEPVHSLFESAIKRSVKAGDAYFKVGDLAYVVVYRDLSLQEAQLKCAALAREVCAYLFGEEGMDIAVKSLVGQIDKAMLLGYRNLEAAIENSLERTGTETIVSLSDLYAAAPETPAKLTQAEIAFTQHPRHRMTCAIEQLSYLYRPIWDCSLKVIVSYLCQPYPPGPRDATASHAAGFCTAMSGDGHRVALDCAVLMHCVNRIETLRQTGSRILLAVPVHFSTLARSRSWAEFNAVYRKINPDVLRDLQFIVFDLHGVPNLRLAQELPKLARARSVFCAIERGDSVARFANTSIHAIGSELPNTPLMETDVIGHVKSLSNAAKQNGFESFLLGVESTSRALAAMASGVRYLEGPAIHALVGDPRHALMHELEDLYREPVAV